MLHVVGLAMDKSPEVQNYSLCLVTLPGQGLCGMLQCSQLILIPSSLSLKVFSNSLLKDKRFHGLISLSFGPGQSKSEAGSIVLLLIDEGSKAAVLALVRFNLDLKFRDLLGKLVHKCLEFEELAFECVELLFEEVVTLVDLRQLGVHTAFEVDEVLPGIQSLPRILVALPLQLIEVSHGNLGHQWLLD